MITKFNAGNISPFCEGFLNNIYDGAQRMIEDRLNHPEHGEMDARFVKEAVESSWAAEMSTQYAPLLLSMLQSGQIPAEQVENFHLAKKRIMSSLFGFIRTNELAPVVQVVHGEEFDNTLPVCDGYYWTLQKRNLERKYQAPVVASIDRQSSRVLKHILMPEGKNEFRKMGLVLGQVQSGKTANYSALIAKAFDFGYKLIIVLSGIHNDLRRQTQERLDEEILGYHEYKYLNAQDLGTRTVSSSQRCGVGQDPDYRSDRAPECATYTDDDFRGLLKSGAGKKGPVLFVIKKNTSVFSRILEYFKEPSNNARYREWPVLMIDDEADQASVNTSKGELASATNRYIRRLLKIFPKATYVGYTATPFANILIDANKETKSEGIDLFPKDFIVHLPAPTNYFGPKQFFGDNKEDEGLGLFMAVSDETSAALTGVGRKGASKRRCKVVLDALPPECEKFFHQFLISAAIRQWRHKRANPEAWRDDGSESMKPKLEMSMLVHVSSYVKDQKVIARLFKDLVNNTRELMKSNERDRRRVLEAMGELFEGQKAVTEQTRRMREECDLSSDWALPDSLESLVPDIEHVVEDLSLKVVNGDKEMSEEVQPEEESWDRPRSAPVVFIGGNKLSRGLPLPGLCVSLFLRSSTMYDTLLQMGRWFGYRDGYVDLCRICTTTHIIERFRAITEACLDFERQIDRMTKANRRPENFRLSILSHTGLLVTARNKMCHADDAKISFNGEILDCRDIGLSTEELVNNWHAAKRLYGAAQESGRMVYASKDYGLVAPESTSMFIGSSRHPSGRLWRDVPVAAVLEFLDTYQWSGGKTDLTQRAVANYIRTVARTGEVVRWNVFIPGAAGGGTFGMSYVERTMNVPSDGRSGWLRALKTGDHEYVGVTEDVVELAKGQQGKEPLKRGELYRAVREAQGTLHPDAGHLILYMMRPASNSLPTEKWFEEAKSVAGEYVPAISYYLWLPKTKKDHQTSIAVFNNTVVHQDEDDWDEKTPELEDEE